MNNFKVLEHNRPRQWFVPREDRDTPIKAEQLREIQPNQSDPAQNIRYPIIFPDGKGGYLSQEEGQRRAEIMLKEEAARLQAAEKSMKKEQALTGRTAIETEAPTQKQELRYAIVFPDGKGGHLSQEEGQRRAEIMLKEEAARLQAAEEAIKKEEEQKPLVPCASSPQNEQTNESYSLKEIIDTASQSLEEMETSDRNVILREMYPVASPSNYSQTQGWMLQQPLFSQVPAVPVPSQNQPTFSVNTGKAIGKVNAHSITTMLLQGEQHQLNIRIINEMAYVYDGICYKVLSVRMMQRLLYLYCRPFVAAIGDSSIIKKIYDLIMIYPDICHKQEPDSASYFLAFDNGILDVRSMRLQPHSPEIFVTSRVIGNFCPEQSLACPVFDQFLYTVSGGDSVLTQRIWEAIGYILTPDYRGKCFFLLQGVPDSGKSLLGALIASFFEDEDVTALDIDAFGERFGPSDLVDKHLCLSMDLSAGLWDSRSAGMIKSLTGGDMLTVDIKYQPRAKFRNKAKILFATNHAVGTKEDDSALLRRVVCIPFRYSVPREAQDQELLAKLKQERDAILTRALIAYGTLRSKKYIFSGDGVYHLNDVVNGGRFGGVAPALSLDEAILGFAHRHCRSVATEEAFMADLFGAFQKENPAMKHIQVQTFSAKLHKILDDMFPSQLEFKSKRREAGTNPISCVIGLQLIL